METSANKLLKAIEKMAWTRPYRPYSLSKNIIEKIFNRGMGSLALFKFDIDNKTIKINTYLYNKADERKLSKLIAENGLESWEIKKVSYGYPDYYQHNF